MTMDETGRLPGRGAYLCRDAGCWTLATERGALGRALEAAVPPELRELLDGDRRRQLNRAAFARVDRLHL